MIEGQDARLMCHFDACELIKMGGNNVELIVRKANSQHLCDENIEQQEKLEQNVVEERYRLEEEKKKKRSLKESMSPPAGTGSSVTSSYSAKSPPVKSLLPEEVSVTLIGNEQSSAPFPVDSHITNVQLNASVTEADPKGQEASSNITIGRCCILFLSR
ncbi:hypothetical protein Avbf_12557 [Armadillidium vulgare]|nr:hypothetical protein Avbf_12557 [Armadillidium vulgare]